MATLEELLANPAMYHQSGVAVSGIFYFGREHCALYSSLQDVRAPKKGIWLVSPEVACGKSALKAMNRKTVKVSGVFISKPKRGAGHFRGWPAEIRGITEITPVTL